PTLSAQIAAEPPHTLQILAWMAAAIGLWEPLAQAGCAQSLLEESNLRVDEDLVLGLQQLYEDQPGRLPTLADLGALWQRLFETYLQDAPSLAQFLQDTADGDINNLDAFYSRLEAIAYDQEGSTAISLAEDFEADEEEATVVLPMQLQSVDCIGLTDVGRRRSHNEDFFFTRTILSKQESPLLGSRVIGSGLYIVCDGMGGHAAGEVASEMAADTLHQYIDKHWQNGSLPDEETLQESIYTTNDALFQANQEKSRSGLGRMGTTLVMVIMQGTSVAIAHVGDSRVYKVTRRGGLEQITIDHEVGQRNIQRGIAPEIAYAQPDAYQLTQAIGPRGNDMIVPDIQFADIDEDTILLLCSDGLSDNDLLEENYETHLLPLISSKANLRQGMEDLIAFANQHNGHDNITGVLVRIKVAPAAGA
ncbi:MAG: serine/threonine phosphatase, partial [Cyanobacteria bacterium J06641_5]